MRRSQRSQFDYHSYRGRTTVTDWLKRIALVLAVLVVILVAVLFFGQGSISYTDEGLRIHWPFSQQTEPQTPDPGNVTVIEGDPAALPDASQEGETTPPEEPQEDASSILSVSLSSLLDGSAAQLAQEAGADGVVVTMKDDQGALGWQSQQTLASALQDGVYSGTVNAALTAWNEGDVYTVARLSCFRDEALGSNMDYTLRTSSDYRWRDSGDLHWATPSNEAVRSYLIGLMTELAQMGFDDVAHTAHGIKRLHRSACKKRASRRRSRQEAGRIRQRVGRFVRATTDCFRHEADHVPLTRGRRRSLCDKGKGRHLTDNFHNPSKALPFQIRFGQARRTSLQPKAMAIINFFITRS